MKKISLFLLACIPFLTWAHPGHDETDGYTIIHYFTAPQHAIITIGVMAAAIVLIIRERRKKNQSL